MVVAGAICELVAGAVVVCASAGVASSASEVAISTNVFMCSSSLQD
jgi:hypothetical protein